MSPLIELRRAISHAPMIAQEASCETRVGQVRDDAKRQAVTLSSMAASGVLHEGRRREVAGALLWSRRHCLMWKSRWLMQGSSARASHRRRDRFSGVDEDDGRQLDTSHKRLTCTVRQPAEELIEWDRGFTTVVWLVEVLIEEKTPSRGTETR